MLASSLDFGASYFEGRVEALVLRPTPWRLGAGYLCGTCQDRL